ncbi:hypothetical protein WJR50_20605 [Catalinimonas sp. 4WD22]|uniref:hypothetical protein n=1 Tax=Catalinimonas locisalis TaxID=3133978 RepID=UPI0031011C07
MKNVRTLLLSLTLMMSSTFVAFAHPGHGHHQQEPNGLMHYLTSPIHLISILLIIGLAFYVAYKKGLLPLKNSGRK